MPNSSITIVSPVSGETVYLPPNTTLTFSADYENGEGATTTVYACGTCSGQGHNAHTGSATNVTGSADGSATVDMGAHTGTIENVTLTARLLSGQNTGTVYAEGSVSGITVTTTPPALEVNKPAMGGNVGAPAMAADLAVNPAQDLTLSGRVNGAAYLTGTITLLLVSKRKKGKLLPVYLAKGIAIQATGATTGTWTHTIKQADLAALGKLRRAEVYLLDKNGDLVTFATQALKV